MRCGGCSVSGFCGERIDDGYVQLSEVAHVAGCDSQLVDDGYGGDQGVLDQFARLPVHQPGPLTESRGIDRQDVVTGDHQFQPVFKFLGFDRIAAAFEFDAGLDFPDSDCAQVQMPAGNASNLLHDRWIWAWPPQLRHNVGIE